MFLSILLLSGFHKLLDRKIYWEKTPDTFVHASKQALQARYDSIHRNTFDHILRNLLCDNEHLYK